jgi:hypothetical protein
VLTIKVMARFGRWLVDRVEDMGVDVRQHARCAMPTADGVCGELIRYVHVCRLEGNEREWRVGSTCGPTLVEISAQLYDDRVTKVASFDLLARIERLRDLPAETHRRAVWVEAAEMVRSGDVHSSKLTAHLTRRYPDLTIIKKRVRLGERQNELGRLSRRPG